MDTLEDQKCLGSKCVIVLVIGRVYLYFTYGKFACIILSPSANEASHSGHLRQFELYTIITQRIALMPIAACLASGRLCLFT